MDKYIVAFKHNGKIALPDDEEAAAIQAPITLLPMLQEGAFEFYSIKHIFPSERTIQFDYDPTASETYTIVEVKMMLTDDEAENTEALLKKVADDLAAQHLLLERIDEELYSDPMFAEAKLSTEEKIELAEGEEVDEDTATSQTIITFSHRDRNRHYLVELKYNGQLEAVEQKASDGHIIHELVMMMQADADAQDAIQLVSYELTHDEEIDNHCDEGDSNENKTEFHIRLQVNEFVLDLHDPEAVYYYVLGQLVNCQPEITFRYPCGEPPLQKTVIGIDLHCSMETLSSGIIEDLFN